MAEYKPDGFVILKIENQAETKPHPLYKVFGSWAGGFLDSDQWRFNSGVCRIDVHFETGVVKFQGHSGSVYECTIASEGKLTAYNAGVLHTLINDVNDRGLSKCSIITLTQLLEEFENE